MPAAGYAPHSVRKERSTVGTRLSWSAMPTFTVTVEGFERHDGEAPFTYILEAANMGAAQQSALLYHVMFVGSPEDPFLAPSTPDESGEASFRIVHGDQFTFVGEPHHAVYAYNDLR